MSHAMATTEHEQDPVRIDLEAKLTFLERSVEVMSKVMHEQGMQIEQLEQRLAALGGKLEAGDDGAVLRPHDDPPPHY